MNDIERRVKDAIENEEEDSPLEELVAGVVIALIFLVGFGLFALGNPWFWVAFPVGFAGVLPAAIALVKLYESRQKQDTDAVDETADALETLRRRYAVGELTEEEFEEKVEHLLETETVADARKTTESRRAREDTDSVEFERS